MQYYAFVAAYVFCNIILFFIQKYIERAKKNRGNNDNVIRSWHNATSMFLMMKLYKQLHISYVITDLPLEETFIKFDLIFYVMMLQTDWKTLKTLSCCLVLLLILKVCPPSQGVCLSCLVLNLSNQLLCVHSINKHMRYECMKHRLIQYKPGAKNIFYRRNRDLYTIEQKFKGVRKPVTGS